MNNKKVWAKKNIYDFFFITLHKSYDPWVYEHPLREKMIHQAQVQNCNKSELKISVLEQNFACVNKLMGLSKSIEPFQCLEGHKK